MPLRNINQARGGPLNILPGRILLPGCASLATSIAVALWPYSKPRLAPPIGKSWPESRSRCVEWSKGGAEKKKKLFDACEGADSSTGCQHGLPARVAVQAAVQAAVAARPCVLCTCSLSEPRVVLRTCRMYGLLREGGQPREAVPAACRVQARRCGKNESYGENPRARKTSTLQTPTMEATMHLQCL